MEGGQKQVGYKQEDEEEDFFNVTIQRSGCSTEHYTLQECFADKADWRQCKAEMTQFKMCMDEQRKAKHSSEVNKQ